MVLCLAPGHPLPSHTADAAALLLPFVGQHTVLEAEGQLSIATAVEAVQTPNALQHAEKSLPQLSATSADERALQSSRFQESCMAGPALADLSFRPAWAVADEEASSLKSWAASSSFCQPSDACARVASMKSINGKATLGR